MIAMPIAAHDPVAPGWVWRRNVANDGWEARTLTGDVIVRPLNDGAGGLCIIVNKWRRASGCIDANGHALVPSAVLVAVARANDHVVGVQ